MYLRIFPWKDFAGLYSISQKYRKTFSTERKRNEMRKILEKILLNDDMSSSEKEIVLYGFQAFAEMTCGILICFIIMAVMKMYLEGIIFFAMFIPLRSFAGGFHCERWWICMITSAVSFLVILFLSDIDLFSSKSAYIVSSVCLAVIAMIAPVINDARPVLESEYPKFGKRLLGQLVCIFCAETVFFYFHQAHYLRLMMIVLLFMVLILVMGKLKWKRLNRRNSYIGRWLKNRKCSMLRSH